MRTGRGLFLLFAIVLAGLSGARGQSAPLHPTLQNVSRLPLPPAGDGSVPSSPSDLPFVDLNEYFVPGSGEPVFLPDVWDWQLLPLGIIYPSYLAGTKEPRFAAHVINAKNDGWLFEGILGTRVGLLRFGNHDPLRPEGWQIDAEGAAQVRQDVPEDLDVRSVDFRAGLPITYGKGPYRFKFGYYHLSSHVGDELLIKNPTFDRLNFSRDVLLIGSMFYLTEQLRVYGEAGWAFKLDVSKPWEFQFGVDYLPCGPTGFAGAPFFAINGHLRQELNYGGALTAQAGWAWRSATSTNLLRLGAHYYNGESNQLSFFDENEEQFGLGVWYDF